MLSNFNNGAAFNAMGSQPTGNRPAGNRPAASLNSGNNQRPGAGKWGQFANSQQNQYQNRPAQQNQYAQARINFPCRLKALIRLK